MLSSTIWQDVAGLALVPLALWALGAGWGLLLERVLRVRVQTVLLAPLGVCASILTALAVYTTGAGNHVAVPVAVVPSLAGYVLARGELRDRLRPRPSWGLALALSVYVLFQLGPLLLGHWTFSGYNIENDSAYELLLVGNLQAHGTHLPPGSVSTARTSLQAYLATGYPLGSQSLLALLSGILGTSPAVIWQGFLSALAMIGALAASTLSRRTMSRGAAAVVAGLAVAAALTYEYALQGSIKEIALVTTMLCSLALIREAIGSAKGIGALVLCALPLAAVLAVYSAAGIPFVLAIAGSGVLGMFLVERRLWRRSWMLPIAAGIGVFVLVSLPTLIELKTFLHTAKVGYTTGSPTAPTLGPLFRALPLSEISGIWLAGDYRFAVPPGTAGILTAAATVVVLQLLVLGVVVNLRGREPGPLMGLVTIGLVLLIVYPRVTPYAQAKLLAVGSPIVLLVAFQGLAVAPRMLEWRALAGLVGVGLAAAILASDALAYHDFPVAPTARLEALHAVGRKLGDRGPLLDSEFEQFAKYFALPAQLIDGTDAPTPIALALRQPAPLYTHSFDLDQETLQFVESFPYVLTRPSPAASRPPANYSSIYRNRFYELWRREAGPQVLNHMPLGTPIDAASTASCASLHALVAGAPAGSHLAAATAPEAEGFLAGDITNRSPGWVPSGEGRLLTTTPGFVEARVRLRSAGRFAIWLQGDFPRRVSVLVDGRAAGSTIGSQEPENWLEAGSVELSAGTHRLRVERGGGNLQAGDGSGQAALGGVVLAAQAPRRISTYPLGAWRSLCGQSFDWLELTAAG